jgi:ATP:ADP antiporter, AAA family
VQSRSRVTDRRPSQLADAWRSTSRSAAKRAIVLWGAAAFAALLASYSMFRPVRDALLLERSPDDIPWVFTATFVVVIVTSPLWSAVLARWPRGRVVPLAFHVFAASTVVFCVLVYLQVAPATVGSVFYVWLSMFNLFVVSVFWSVLADQMGHITARELYGLIAAGGTIGAFVGPLLTQFLVDQTGVHGILLISGLLLELPVIAMQYLRRAAAELPDDSTAREPDAPSGGGAFTGIAHVARSPYLAAIVGYVLCTASAATFLYLAQADIAKAGLPDRVARTEYFASIDFWTQFVAFVLQTLVVGPALVRFGPGVVLCVLPLVQAIGITAVTLAPSLIVAAIAQVAAKAPTHGLIRPSRELLFTVVSRDDKYRAKHAIDTIGYRLGDLASAWARTGIVKGSALIGASAAAVLVGFTIALAALWLGLAVALGIGFRRRAARKEAERRDAPASPPPG